MKSEAVCQDVPQNWIEAELRLAGGLDSRIIGLLRAIHDTGSLNQAAKQAGLSYKGAWQMIERANNLAPKVLVATATGGNKGGGTVLTKGGRALLTLYDHLDCKHRLFLAQLNRELLNDPEMAILLKSLAVKSSATNQLFGHVFSIRIGAVNTEIDVILKGGDHIFASMANEEFTSLSFKEDDKVLLLINQCEINVLTGEINYDLSARNSLKGTVIRVQQDGIDFEMVIKLAGGDTIAAVVTQVSADLLGVDPGISVTLVFKSNAVLLGAMVSSEAGTQSSPDELNVLVKT